MKRLLTIMILATVTFASWAQTANPLDQLKANPKRAYGTDFPYSFDVPALTKAPKGYKPFYISHYSRHGSRYYWNEMLYPQLDTLLVTAHRRHQLTPEGERFYEADDPTGPLGIYGKSKLAGEEALRETWGKHFILRTSWVFGIHGKKSRGSL